ncbi:hypothetical protein E2C06_32820 [Dankookia rubra]|uniref:Uncharacterized protein n=1 Tax=Dankookia rubra TaxID=1442381 RepID=A0A4R5Q750_9PROT|nr:hypothetical protein [Dankookia rubra]TDH58383.1 hypothetical protein E2C06_32820 [Dankookia rubra]
MSAGWINAVAIVETADTPKFVRVLERHVSGADASYWLEEHLCFVADTEEDEVWFRIAALDEITIPDIQQVGECGYLLPPRLSGEVHRWLDEGLFEGRAVALTVVGLELRDDGVLRHLGAALHAERASFMGQPPQLCCA